MVVDGGAQTVDPRKREEFRAYLRRCYMDVTEDGGTIMNFHNHRGYIIFFAGGPSIVNGFSGRGSVLHGRRMLTVYRSGHQWYVVVEPGTTDAEFRKILSNPTVVGSLGRLESKVDRIESGNGSTRAGSKLAPVPSNAVLLGSDLSEIVRSLGDPQTSGDVERLSTNGPTVGTAAGVKGDEPFSIKGRTSAGTGNGGSGHDVRGVGVSGSDRPVVGTAHPDPASSGPRRLVSESLAEWPVNDTTGDGEDSVVASVGRPSSSSLSSSVSSSASTTMSMAGEASTAGFGSSHGDQGFEPSHGNPGPMAVESQGDLGSIGVGPQDGSSSMGSHGRDLGPVGFHDDFGSTRSTIKAPWRDLASNEPGHALEQAIRSGAVKGGYELDNYRRGIEGERKTAEAVESSGVHGLLLNGVGVTRTMDIDHIFITDRGIFVINSKNINGGVRLVDDEIYCGSSTRPLKSTWVQTLDNNVLLIRGKLAEAGYPTSIPIIPLIVVWGGPVTVSGVHDGTFVEGGRLASWLAGRYAAGPVEMDRPLFRWLTSDMRRSSFWMK